MTKEVKNIFYLEPIGDKIYVKLNGDTIHRASSLSAAQETIRKRRAGLSNVSIELAPGMTAEGVMNTLGIQGGFQETSNQFSVEERFMMLADLTEMVADDQATSLICLGEGGIGKTHTIMDTLVKKGFKDLLTEMELHEPGSVIRKHKTFRFIKGYSSAKGLYRALHDNNGVTIIFDDCDDVHKDKTGTSILKSALDTLDRRQIYWNAEEPIGGDGLPRNFEFTGSVIFISNLPAHKFDQALRTRALRVDLSMTKAEIVERMKWIIETQERFLPDVKTRHKTEALKHIEEIADQIQNLSLRTLILACKVRHGDKPHWKDLATYSLTR